jgi:DNA invertase Pin-like site-specific DNA recombinase
VKGKDQRPAFDALCRDATKREFDMVMAWSVDRLGRSLQDLVGFLSELHALKIDLFLHQQGLDTTTPSGKAMFQMLGVFAEFERAMIKERVRAGLARARSEGKTLGRPKDRRGNGTRYPSGAQEEEPTRIAQDRFTARRWRRNGAARPCCSWLMTSAMKWGGVEAMKNGANCHSCS